MSAARRATRLCAAVVALGVVTSCSGGRRASPPPSTAVASTTTTATTEPDNAAITLPTVAGGTTIAPVPVTPGPVAVSGTVVDDTGAPVAAATVALQRVVNGRVGSTQVTSAEDGTWNVQGILGGLYRIRAWRPPDLAQPNGVVVFLPATGAASAVALKVQHYTGTTVQTTASPNPPIIGEPVDVVVQVTTASVTGDGIIHQAPQVGSLVAITAAGQWAVDGTPVQPTATNGQVSWLATCEALGAQGLSVSVNGGGDVAVSIGSCSPVPPTTTTTSTTTTVAVPTTVKR